MSKKIFIVTVFLIAVFLLLAFKNSDKKPVSPVASPAPSSYNPPKEIKYDSSTDLKKELDIVNPQVLESDFDTE